MEVVMKKRFSIVFAVMMIVSLLTCGCSRKSRNTGYSEGASNYIYDDYVMDYDTPMADYAASEEVFYESKAAPAAVNMESPAAQKRMIQRSASINIQVMDPEQAAASIIELTENMGGFVISSSSSQEHYSGDIYLPKADLSIRVPAERLMEMLAFVEGLTTDTSKYVSNKRIYGVDITSDYVDMSSRLTSLEKTRDKLYEILDTAQNAEEALEVYSSIADVESDIEVYKGQIKYMEESVALSSVDIKISSVKPAPTKTVQKWNPFETVKDAFGSLLDTGKDVIDYLIYFIIAVIPVLVLIAIPIFLIVLLIKKLIRRNKAKSQNKKPTGKANEKTEDVLSEVEIK